MGLGRHVRKNDTVMVIAGKDRGRKGRILRLAAGTSSAVVEGMHLVKRHTKANPQKNVKGGIVEKEAPIHISNLMVVCGGCGKPTRVGHRRLDDGRKVRICKKCNGPVDK
jgi:large subunit ribosomal protein L24